MILEETTATIVPTTLFVGQDKTALQPEEVQYSKNRKNDRHFNRRLIVSVLGLGLCLALVRSESSILSSFKEYAPLRRELFLTPTLLPTLTPTLTPTLLPTLTLTPSPTPNELKIAIYMTTHLSDSHKQFLERCWHAAQDNLSLLQQADLIVYTSDHNTTNDHFYNGLGFKNVTIYRYSVYAYQGGAAVALVDPFKQENQWLEGYDWVVRLNPDVLIRKDEWLLHTMKNESCHGILIDWSNRKWSAIHTDFMAFRPHAVNGTALIHQYEKNNGRVHTERHAYHGFTNMIQEGRVQWLPDVKSVMAARTVGINSSVIHSHDLLRHCPDYFNATDGRYYR